MSDTLELYAVRHKQTGAYFGATSEAPTVYLTAGKAEGRRKTIDVKRKCDWENRCWIKEDTQEYEVVRFSITVSPAQ